MLRTITLMFLLLTPSLAQETAPVGSRTIYRMEVRKDFLDGLEDQASEPVRRQCMFILKMSICANEGRWIEKDDVLYAETPAVLDSWDKDVMSVTILASDDACPVFQDVEPEGDYVGLRAIEASQLALSRNLGFAIAAVDDFCPGKPLVMQELASNSGTILFTIRGGLILKAEMQPRNF